MEMQKGAPDGEARGLIQLTEKKTEICMANRGSAECSRSKPSTLLKTWAVIHSTGSVSVEWALGVDGEGEPALASKGGGIVLFWCERGSGPLANKGFSDEPAFFPKRICARSRRPSRSNRNGLS
jgi:hypothetical protein